MPEYEIDRPESRERFAYRYYRMSNMMKWSGIIYGILFLGLFIYFSVWPPIENILVAKHNILIAELEGYKKIPNLEERISTIEKQLTALTTENIEARLAIIEKAISVGEVKPEDLKSIQSLRDDFLVMKSFMFSKPEQLVDFKTLQRDYQGLNADISKIMAKEDILREIDSVRNVFYATLSIFGIVVSIFAGAWFLAFRRQVKPRTELKAQQEAPPDS